QRHRKPPLQSRVDASRFQTLWPTFQKKLINVTLAPQITAAPQEIRTPIFPLPLKCGFEELEPKPHTIAETINAKTLRIRPTVMIAPTMVRSWSIPGSPESLGLMSISAGMTGTRLAASVTRVRMVMAGRSFVATAREGFSRSGAPAFPDTQK